MLSGRLWQDLSDARDFYPGDVRVLLRVRNIVFGLGLIIT